MQHRRPGRFGVRLFQKAPHVLGHEPRARKEARVRKPLLSPVVDLLQLQVRNRAQFPMRFRSSLRLPIGQRHPSRQGQHRGKEQE